MEHEHHHSGSARNLIIALGINILLTLAQIIGGILAGSLALIADALHNLSDAASLGIALGARRIARKPPDERRTFGYKRAETIGALINLTTLIVVGVYLISEAVMRLFEPKEIDGWVVVIIAGVALVIDIVTAVLTWAMSKESLNIRAAFVHNLSDAFASVGVIVSGTLILLYGWQWTDLAVTILISGYVLWQGVSMMRPTIHVLMESVPSDIDVEELWQDLVSIEGVVDLHHIHVWELDEESRALEAHVVVESAYLEEIETVKQQLKERLEEKYRLHHSTLEFESKTGEVNSSHVHSG